MKYPNPIDPNRTPHIKVDAFIFSTPIYAEHPAVASREFLNTISLTKTPVPSIATLICPLDGTTLTVTKPLRPIS
jgi:hypothetical protein